MKNILRLLILSCLSLSCILTSCSKSEDDKICVDPMSQPKCGSALLSFDADQFNSLSTDPISVVNIELINTCLIVELAYSGCGQRDIETMAFIDDSAFVPFVHAKIRNVDPMEECLAFFNHQDTFDLSSTGLQLNHNMTVVIEDWNETFSLDLDE